MRHRVRGHARIHARLIQRQRIEGREHTDIRQNRRIVFGVAVAVWGHVHNQRNVEIRAAIDDSLGVFSHAGIEQLVGVAVVKADRVKVARAQAAAAADALVVIDVHLALLVVEHQTAVGAFALAATAAATDILVDARLAVGVLLGLARA